MRYAKQLEKERQKRRNEIALIEWCIEQKRKDIFNAFRMKYIIKDDFFTPERLSNILLSYSSELSKLQSDLKVLEQVYK